MALERTQEEAKHSDGSSSQTLTKFDSILFNSDEGPASSLFSEGGLKCTSLVSSGDPKIPTQSSPGVENASGISPPAVMIATKVHVPGEEDIPRTVVQDKLREQLHKAQADLATERFNRKRKEKSLIKLAKELNSRTANGHVTEKKMMEMVETIEDLEIRLAERNRHISVKLPELQAECAKREGELADAAKMNQRLLQELEGVQSELGMAKRDLMQVTRAVPSPPDIAGRSQLPVDTLDIGRTDESRKRGVGGASIVIGCMALFATIIGVGLKTEALSLDGICAPVQPGSKFSGTDQGVFEAPWWAPKAAKERVFPVVCGERLRTRVEVGYGNVEVFGAAGKSLWRGRAMGGVTVNSNFISTRTKRGSVDLVPSPWAV